MITAAIIINGQPIMARSATRQEEINKRGEVRYLVDDGSSVWHDPEKGVVPLAIKLLKTIKEQQ